MKKLIEKFMKVFSDYNYNEVASNSDILFELINIILEMVSVTNGEEKEIIKTLSLFVKDLFNCDLAGEEVDKMYENNILPILVELDNKYKDIDLRMEIKKDIEQEPISTEAVFNMMKSNAINVFDQLRDSSVPVAMVSLRLLAKMEVNHDNESIQLLSKEIVNQCQILIDQLLDDLFINQESVEKAISCIFNIEYTDT